MITIAETNENYKVVIIPEIIFKNKQDIDWNQVEKYIKRYVGEFVNIIETNDIVCMGNDFPDEYANSNYTIKIKGSYAKAKANAAQGLKEIITIATQKEYRDNYKDKHSKNAANGWYYYVTHFAIPVYDNGEKTTLYNIYSARLVINKAQNGKLYFYDMVGIKKEACTPLKNR